MHPLVIVPTYNEAENLPVLVALLLALPVGGLEVLVVDDESPDGTGALADAMADDDPRLHVLHRTPPRGYAAASLDGFRWALAHDAPLVLTMDADLSHDPDAIPAMIARIEDGADVVIGSRFVPGGGLQVDWSAFRLAVSHQGSAYARLMIGTSVRDCTSGYRCYRRDVLERLDLDTITSRGYSFLIEVLARVLAKGARVEEVPITYVDRRAGASKISYPIILEALGRTTAIGFGRLFGRR